MIEFTAFSQISKRSSADVIALPFWREKEKAKPAASFKEFDSFFELPIEEKDFRGKEGEILPIYAAKQKEKRIVLLGLGSKADLDEEALRRVYGAFSKWCHAKGLTSINILIPEGKDLDREAEVIAEGLLLANYAFDALKAESIKDQERKLIRKVGFVGSTQKAMERCENLNIVMESVYFARDLINNNADDINPECLAEKAKEIGKELSHVKTTVLTLKQLQKEKMGLLIAVGRAAVNEPTLSVLEYQGNPHSKEKVAIVGKGITYDTGGLNLKSSGMETMKADMSGAAAVLGTIQAAAKLKLKVNLVGVIPAAENAIGSRSYKAGDVYRSRSGKTVEISNTDAEGRLILADALDYVQDIYRPTQIIDLATLTGGIVIALGEELTGLFSNNDKLAHQLIAAGEKTAEKLWRMPLHGPYLDMMKSKVADLQNAGSRKASSITAALFLQEFVRKGTPWAHLDIAGTAYPSEIKGYYTSFGTGVGVRLLIQFLSVL